jgi:hypothetical protein
MAVLPAAWAVLAPWLLGVLVLRALGLRPRNDPLAFAGWSLCAGSLALGVLLLTALLLGVPPGWFWVLPLCGAAALAFWRRPAATLPPVPVDGPWWLCGVGALLALTVLRMLAASAWPCFEGDEGNIWSLKAKTLFAGLGPEFASMQVFNLHPDYPLLNPLLQTWVYACNGGIVLFENRWPVLCFVPAMVLIAAAALRRCLRPLPAFLVLVLLVGCREMRISSGRAFGDAMVACGMLLLLDGWLRWQDSPQPQYRRLAALGLAVAAWSKNETAMYVCAIAAGAAITALLERRRLRPLCLLPWIGPAIAVLAVQWTFNWSFGLHNDLLGHNPTGKGMAALLLEQFPERVLPVLLRAGAEMIDPGSPQGAMLLLVPLGLFWAWWRGLFPRLWVPGFALLVALAGMHAVYVGSFLDLQRHMDTSYARVLFQALPAALLWLAALAAAMLARPVEPATP